MFGSKSLNKVKKLILKPTERGTKLKIVVIAVNKTGLNRDLQDSIIDSYFNSISFLFSLDSNCFFLSRIISE